MALDSIVSENKRKNSRTLHTEWKPPLDYILVTLTVGKLKGRDASFPNFPSNTNIITLNCELAFIC